MQEWITAVGEKTAYIERGSPWENGYIETFNARLRDDEAFARETCSRSKPIHDDVSSGRRFLGCSGKAKSTSFVSGPQAAPTKIRKAPITTRASTVYL